MRVDREARNVSVPRRLWGRRAVPFDEIIGVGTTDTALVIGRWSDGERVACLTVDKEDAKKYICIKCYSICSYRFPRGKFRKSYELCKVIDEPDHVKWVNRWADLPVMSLGERLSQGLSPPP